jgi:hypothetical protein
VELGLSGVASHVQVRAKLKCFRAQSQSEIVERPFKEIELAHGRSAIAGINVLPSERKVCNFVGGIEVEDFAPAPSEMQQLETPQPERVSAAFDPRLELVLWQQCPIERQCAHRGFDVARRERSLREVLELVHVDHDTGTREQRHHLVAESHGVGDGPSCEECRLVES